MNGVGVTVFGILAALAGVVVFVALAFKLLEGFFWLLSRIFGFLWREVGDTLRMVGSLLAATVLLVPALLSILFGRWSRAAHYRRSIGAELGAAGLALYRVALGNPMRFLGLCVVTDALERRVPAAVARAPITDLPRQSGGDQKPFPGYEVVGSLPTGGSGARLYVAQPTFDKLSQFATSGFPSVGQVVIKCFSSQNGPALPQIVRESRALEAARRLGLVLDHALDEQRFYYVMPYVPGENLAVVTDRLHARAGAAGLSTPLLRVATCYLSDLLLTLERYHGAGLLHKDVKPDNIVVCGSRAYLVDLGLVTPLHSAMTLTTHGTEYFRDPEMVRMAMKGTKVNEVDAVRFDLYGAGAVLYSLVEGSFPAHGGLSKITKNCPEALKWIVRRAMADLRGRYGSAREMLLDVHKVMAAEDPFAVKPAELPSMGGTAPDHFAAASPEAKAAFAVLAAAGPAAASRRGMPPPPPPALAAPAKKKRGFLHKLVMTAAALLLVFGGLAALFLPARMHSISTAYHHDESLPSFYQPYQKPWFKPEQRGPWAWAEGATVLAEEQEEDCEQLPRFDSTSVTTFPVGSASLASESYTASAAPVVLVIDDYSPVGLDQAPEVELTYSVLRGQGFEVLGDGDLDQEMGLLAGAHHAIGVQSLETALRSLGAYLSASGAVDAAVWLRKGEEPEQLDCHLIHLGDRCQERLSMVLGLP